MNNFIFYSPTEFVFGKDTELQTGTLVQKYHGTKALIVYGGGSVIRSGLLDRVKKSLEEADIAYIELGRTLPTRKCMKASNWEDGKRWISSCL